MHRGNYLNVVLVGYFLFLFSIVISRMMEEISAIDIIYLVALVCSALKLFLLYLESGKKE